MEARPPVPPSEGAQKWPETSELHSFRRSRENAGKHDSFRRSKRRRILQNDLTEAAEALRRFHSFRRSKENAGKHDSFRRSKRRRILQNGLPEAVGALQQFYSFRRSRLIPERRKFPLVVPPVGIDLDIELQEYLLLEEVLHVDAGLSAYALAGRAAGA